MASFNFNVSEAPQPQGYDLLPDGTYAAVAVSSEMRETKSGGEMLVYRMQITDGAFSNRTLFARFNTRNANPKSEEIGKGELARFCRAAGIDEMTDTDDLVGKPVMIRVKSRPAKDGYDAQNEIAGFLAHASQPARSPAPSQPAAPAPRAPAGASRPWSKAA